MRPVSRLFSIPALAVLALLGLAAPASADLTAFLGFSPTPESHSAFGFAAGGGLLIVGFEFEYARMGEDEVELIPSLTTVSGNLLVQTPTRVQFYGTIGGGGYREKLFERQETHVSTNLGGGVKFPLAGPLRVRLDYRLFSLQGSPLHDKVQRFYVGANLAF